MDTSKACHDSGIPPKIIAETADIFAKYFLLGINNAIMKSEFPLILKLADITPAFKKSKRNFNEN